MIEFINNIFLKFVWEMGVLGSIREYQDIWVFALMLFGILACFFGFKTYRAFFSLFTFMGIALVCSFLMRDLTDWGSIVTTFSVIGITLALLAYRWTYLGALAISIMITIALLSMIPNSVIFAFALCALIGFMALSYPVNTVSVLTSIFGGIVIMEVLKLTYISMFILIILGIAIQRVTNKNQDVFEKGDSSNMKKLLKKKSRGRGC